MVYLQSNDLGADKRVESGVRVDSLIWLGINAASYNLNGEIHPRFNCFTGHILKLGIRICFLITSPIDVLFLESSGS